MMDRAEIAPGFYVKYNLMEKQLINLLSNGGMIERITSDNIALKWKSVYKTLRNKNIA